MTERKTKQDIQHYIDLINSQMKWKDKKLTIGGRYNKTYLDVDYKKGGSMTIGSGGTKTEIYDRVFAMYELLRLKDIDKYIKRKKEQ